MMDRGRGLQSWLEDRLAGRPPSPGAIKVLRAVSARPREMAFASTSDAARMAEVNVATVVRCAQMLGFAGWPALRAETRSRYLAGLSASEVLRSHPERSGTIAEHAMKADLRMLHELAQTIDPAQIDRVAQLIHDARTTLVLGSGSFAAPGLQLAHLCQTIGYDVRLHRDGGTSLLNAAALLGPGDLVFLLRLWRSPREIMNAASVARGQGARIVIVADSTTNDVVEMADELVVVPSAGVSMFPTLTASITVVQAVLASLVAQDEDRAGRSFDRAESLWNAFELFPTSGDQ